MKFSKVWKHGASPTRRCNVFPRMPRCTTRRRFSGMLGIRCSANSFRCGSCGIPKTRHRNVGDTFPNAPLRRVRTLKCRVILTPIAARNAGTFIIAPWRVKSIATTSWGCTRNFVKTRRRPKRPTVREKLNSISAGLRRKRVRRAAVWT